MTYFQEILMPSLLMFLGMIFIKIILLHAQAIIFHSCQVDTKVTDYPQLMMGQFTNFQLYNSVKVMCIQ